MDLLLYHNICFDSDFYLLYVVSNNFSQTIFIKKKKKKTYIYVRNISFHVIYVK